MPAASRRGRQGQDEQIPGELHLSGGQPGGCEEAGYEHVYGSGTSDGVRSRPSGGQYGVHLSGRVLPGRAF